MSLYDGSHCSLGYISGNEVHGSGSIIGYIRDNEKSDGSNNIIGYISGSSVMDSSHCSLGSISSNEVFNSSSCLIGYIEAVMYSIVLVAL